MSEASSLWADAPEEGAEQADEAWKVLGPRYEAGLQLEGGPKGRQVPTGSTAMNPGCGSPCRAGWGRQAPR